MTKYIWGLTELDMHILEEGSSAGFLFNISIVLLSTALNLFIVLLTTPVGSLIIYTIIFAIFWTSALLGILFLLQWYRKNSKTKDIMEKIKKNRIN